MSPQINMRILSLQKVNGYAGFKGVFLKTPPDPLAALKNYGAEVIAEMVPEPGSYLNNPQRFLVIR